MTKQDKRVKAEAAATLEAGRIIEAAVAKVQAGEAKPARKAKALDPELAAHAEAIKEARALGTAWWRIAYDLGLPGSADSVARGKAGAGLARRIYSSAFGALPPRVVSEKTKARKHRDATESPASKALREKGNREERAEQVRSGISVIDSTLTDEQIVEMLRGRTLTWTINLNDHDGKGDSFSDDTAVVHPRWCRVYETPQGDRVVSFKIMDPTAKSVDARMNPGGTRIVRLSRIHSVR